jgi:hypothetical protein
MLVNIFKAPNRYFAIALTLIAIQIVIGAILAYRTYSSFSQSYDSALYFQAISEISHGNLNPYLSVAGFYFLGNHGEFIVWPLSVVGFFNNLYLLLVEQLIAVGLCEVLVFKIVVSRITTKETLFSKELIAFVSVSFCVLNPWILWSTSGDFHLEATFAFLILFWVFLELTKSKLANAVFLLVLLSGSVSIVWFFPAALNLFFVRGLRKKEIGIKLGVAIIWWILIEVLIGDKSNTLVNGYGYLANQAHPNKILILEGLFIHAPKLLSTIYNNAQDLYANLFSSSFFGIASAWGLLATLFLGVLNLGSIYRNGVFAEPGFQWLIFYFIIPIETALFLARFNKKVFVFFIVITVCNSVAWLFSVSSQIVPYFDTVSPNAASELTTLKVGNFTPVVSQGIAGRFASHSNLLLLRKPGSLDLRNQPTKFIIAPYDGVETLSTFDSFKVLKFLAGLPTCNVNYLGHNIWIVTCNKLGLINPFNTNGHFAIWAAKSQVGKKNLSGNPALWNVAVNNENQAGYLIYGVNQYLNVGTYQFNVTGASDGPLSVQVWDDTTNTQLAQNTLVSTSASKQTSSFVDFQITKVKKIRPLIGKCIFCAQFAPGSSGDLIELRIYTPGGFYAQVSSASFEKLN